MKLHSRLFYRKKWLETEVRVQKEELQALSGDYSSFDDGKAYVNPSHPYTFDLDVFGRHSLFQAMNRTCTISGKTVWPTGCNTTFVSLLPSAYANKWYRT